MMPVRVTGDVLPTNFLRRFQFSVFQFQKLILGKKIRRSEYFGAQTEHVHSHDQKVEKMPYVQDAQIYIPFAIAKCWTTQAQKKNRKHI